MPTVADSQLFDIFNAYPNLNLGHEFIDAVHGPYPHVEEGYFEWDMPETHSGYAAFRKNGEWSVAEDWKSLGIEKLVETIETGEYIKRPEPYAPEIRMEKTRKVRIHYRLAYPATRARDNLSDLPMTYMLHGVPASDEWKLPMLSRLGRLGVACAFTLLAMGRSTMIWDYEISDAVGNGEHPDAAFDWRYDVPYIVALMDWMQARFGFEMKPGFQSDDWGCGPGLRLAEKHSDRLAWSGFFNAIWMWAYFVIEIGTFANASWMVSPEKKLRRDPDGSFNWAVTNEQKDAYYASLKSFTPAAVTMPMAILQTEKGMVSEESRFKLSRFAETSHMLASKDVDYHAQRYARYMGPDELGLALLCRRSGILAPKIMTPHHPEKNPLGVKFDDIRGPMEVLFAQPDKDQMMSPIEMWQSPYLMRNVRVRVHEIQGADHFAETDKPGYVFRLIYSYMREVYGIDKVPIFIGDEDFVTEGNEPFIKNQLSEAFGAPVTHDPKELDRLYGRPDQKRYPQSTKPGSSTVSSVWTGSEFVSVPTDGRGLGLGLLGGAVLGGAVGYGLGRATRPEPQPQVIVIEKEKETAKGNYGGVF